MEPLAKRIVTSDELAVLVLAAPEIWRSVWQIRYEFVPGTIYYSPDSDVYHFGKYGWEVLRIIE